MVGITAPSSSDEPELPPTVARVKAKLEAATGKTYTYRPKEAMPNIQHMLVHGAPEEKERSNTWLEKAGYPTLMALLFCATFFFFIRFAPKSSRPDIVLPITKNAHLIKERVRIMREMKLESAQMKQTGQRESKSKGEEL